MEVEIRTMNVNDVFTVARILGKITKSARMELVAAFKGKKVDPTYLGMVLIQSLCVEAELELKAWLADVIGKDVEEFGKMPGAVVLDIVEQMMGQADIRDFFARAFSLVTKIPATG